VENKVRFEIYHKSQYNYNSLVTFSHNIARLKPKNTSFQHLINHTLEITPNPYEKNEFIDYWNNYNLHFLITKSHQDFSIVAKSKVDIDTKAIKNYNHKASKSTITYKQLRNTFNNLGLEHYKTKEYLYQSPFIPIDNQEIVDYTMLSFNDNKNVYQSLIDFVNRIYNDFVFDNSFSDISTPVNEIYYAKRGVCQDFAHFAISALRSIGIATRYVSGYIQTIPPKGEKKLFGADASHAWFGVYLPDFGWIDFDPTNNLIPSSSHIVLGYGRDYSDIAPLKGVVLSSGVSKLSVMVDVSTI